VWDASAVGAPCLFLLPVHRCGDAPLREFAWNSGFWLCAFSLPGSDRVPPPRSLVPRLALIGQWVSVSDRGLGAWFESRKSFAVTMACCRSILQFAPKDSPMDRLARRRGLIEGEPHPEQTSPPEKTQHLAESTYRFHPHVALLDAIDQLLRIELPRSGRNHE
jgi:hypothetical protein